MTYNSNEKDWRQTLLYSGATLKKAIQTLNDASLKIALVTLPDGIFIGTITDGDIRRGLLNGLDMNSSIESIIHKGPFFVPPRLGRDSVLQIMQANDVYQLPIIDEDRRVVGLHLWDKIMAPSQRPNLMVIMVGGQGIRLRPKTENCPKPLLPVGGKPMLEHIIERAKADGFQHFVLATHYLGHMIEDYFGDGSRLQVNIDYLREETPLIRTIYKMNHFNSCSNVCSRRNSARWKEHSSPYWKSSERMEYHETIKETLGKIRENFLN